MTPTPYDLVEYPPRAFSQTHPERLATMAVLMGLNRPRIANCRVLDVGCGSGWNVIPMARELVYAEFFGFDLAEKPIAAARADAAELGLHNVRFEALDVMDFPGDAGEFDYIIAHGFYSWVPEPVRHGLLGLCRKHLAPDGVAFISYNANPFGYFRRMWREMMLHHLGREEDPVQRLRAAESLLAALASQYATKAKLRPYAKLLEGQLTAIQQGGGNWFFHDDLGPVFEPVSISRFGEELAGHGLAYAGDALFENLRPREHLPQGLQPANWIETEQYADYLVGRGFRNSLITRAGRPLMHPPPRAAFEQLLYAAPLRSARSNGTTTFRNEWTNAEAEVSDPGLVAAIECIRKAWPDNVSYGQLCSLGGDGVQPDVLLELITNEVIVPSVKPRSFSKDPGTRPEVWAPARLQAARGKVVTNRLHGAVQLEQEPLRELVRSLDGSTRVDLQDKDVADQIEWLRRAALLT